MTDSSDQNNQNSARFGPCLEVEKVSHRYGTLEAVKRASLQIAAGKVHCLLGESGSGKSTLLRIVAGLESADEGRVTIDGIQVAGDGIHVPAEQRPIGLVFQDYALFPNMTILKNVMFGMTRRTRSERRRWAMDLLDLVGLSESAEVYPHTLSGGQQQRIALVRALARRPSVMLLDEPFSGLDPRLRDQIRDTTLSVLRQANVATLLVTHDAREALAAGDQVSVLRDGVILQTDAPARLYSNPVDIHVAEFFGKANLVINADGSSTILRPEDLQTHCLESHSAARINDELCRGTVVAVQFEGATIGYTIKSSRGDCWFIRGSAEKRLSPGQVIAIARKSPFLRRLGNAMEQSAE